jgi:hypothetical protein
MLVLLTKPDEVDVWMGAPWGQASAPHGHFRTARCGSSRAAPRRTATEPKRDGRSGNRTSPANPEASRPVRPKRVVVRVSLGAAWLPTGAWAVGDTNSDDCDNVAAAMRRNAN